MWDHRYSSKDYIYGTLPNDFLTGRYNGILTSNFLLELGYSKKTFAFEGSGGDFTDFEGLNIGPNSINYIAFIGGFTTIVGGLLAFEMARKQAAAAKFLRVAMQSLVLGFGALLVLDGARVARFHLAAVKLDRQARLGALQPEVGDETLDGCVVFDGQRERVARDVRQEAVRRIAPAAEDVGLEHGLPEKEPAIVARWQEMGLYKLLREEAARRGRRPRGRAVRPARRRGAARRPGRPGGLRLDGPDHQRRGLVPPRPGPGRASRRRGKPPEL